MTIADAFEMLQNKQTDNLRLPNKDGLTFIQHAINEDALDTFKITINDTPGKTLIQKLNHDTRPY